MTGRERKIVFAIAQGISAAQAMSRDERAQSIEQAFKHGLSGMREYGLIAMCLLMQE